MKRKNYRKLNDVQKAAYDWQYGLCGDFFSSLFDTISKADEGNLDRLERAFPTEVKAYRRFTRLSGWWQNVEKIMSEE